MMICIEHFACNGSAGHATGSPNVVLHYTLHYVTLYYHYITKLLKTVASFYLTLSLDQS